ncbi:MAG: hypothetical protein M1834_009645 [Cirrosporium novae-zelandiae]|nr:MAG: hypothetical protein M1834_009645 [Cirrosporium novae-zelandiae]
MEPSSATSSVDAHPSALKSEASREDSLSSPAENSEAELAAPSTQTQKRKGGRKPIYATSEERKQRNRQAQAAFRERRTEYIKQLEATIKRQEETLQNLQQSHRSAADECLMLRYKNSLLERILLEKGIDVQAELRSRQGGAHVAQIKASPTSHISPIQRAVVNRQHQVRRPNAAIAPKLDTVEKSNQAAGIYPNQSPQLHPTPPSHASSPSTARSPGFPQGGMTPSTSEFQPQSQMHIQSLPSGMAGNGQPNASVSQTPPGSMHAAISPPMDQKGGHVPPGAGNAPNSYYPSPFQRHIDQLGKLTQQEYDAQADMVDDHDPPSDSVIGNSQFPQASYQFHSVPQNQQGQLNMQNTAYFNHNNAPQNHDGNGQASEGANQLFNPFDPMLDADPFGLSASMHFPTQFGYNPTAARR